MAIVVAKREDILRYPAKHDQWSSSKSIYCRHYPNALVTDSKNLFSVRADNQIDVTSFRLLKEILLHGVLLRQSEIKPLTSAEQVRVIGDCFGLKQEVRSAFTGKHNMSYSLR